MAGINQPVTPLLDIKAVLANNLSATKSDVVTHTPLPLPQNLNMAPLMMPTHIGLPQIPVSVSNTDTVPMSEHTKSDTNVSNNEVSKQYEDDEDDEELCDRIIEVPMETASAPPRHHPL